MRNTDEFWALAGSIIEMMPEGLVILRPDATPRVQNARFRKRADCQPILDALHTKLQGDIRRALRSSTPLPMRIHVEGSSHRASAWRLPLADQAASVVVRLDTTEAPGSFEALSAQIVRLERHMAREREQKTTARLFFEGSSDGIAIIEQGGKILDANKAFLGLLNDGLSEVRGKSLSEILDLDALHWQNGGGPIPKHPFEAQVRSGDTVTTVEVTTTDVRLDDQTRFVVVLRDLSRTARFEESLDRIQILQRAFEQAREAETAKERFLSVVSHELRTPVNALVSAAHLLREEEHLTARQLELLDAIDSASCSALERVNSILGFARFGAAEHRKKPFVPEHILDNIVGYHRPAAERRGLSLTTDFQGPKGTQYFGSATAVHVILQNLISNALKATERGGIRVEMAIEEIGGSDPAMILRLGVEDTGCGIPAPFQARVFETFSSGVMDGNVSEGIGLGLSIVQRMVDEMGGSIDLDSEEGRGTRFDVTVPVVRVPEAQSDENLVVLKTRLRRNHPVRRILVVDDQKINRELAKRLLNRMGFEVQQAENGLEAVNACGGSAPPDLILMDLNMPIMNGIDAARVIRTKENIRQPSIIGLTAFLDPGIRVEMIETGMDDALDKPLDTAKLTALIEEIHGPAKTALVKSPGEPEATSAKDSFVALMEDFRDKALADLVERLPVLDELLTKHDFKAAEDLAHRLAGSTQLAGLEDMGAALRNIEACLKVRDHTGALQERERLMAAFAANGDLSCPLSGGNGRAGQSPNQRPLEAD